MTRPTPPAAEALALFIESASDHAMFLLDADGIVTSWNSGAEALTGWTADAIIGRSAATIYPARQNGGLADDLAQARDAGRLHGEGWRRRADGSEFFAEYFVSELASADGRHFGFGQILCDITERKAAERALERSASHLRSILATVPTAVIVADAAGAILSFSANAERMFGYREAEVVGRHVAMLMATAERERHAGFLRQYLDADARRILDQEWIVTGRRSDGSEFPLELAVGEAPADDTRIFTGFLRDLTEQQVAELRLKELQSELIHVSRLSAMGTMASTLAHELNQPLTAIANYLEAGADLLAGGPLAPDQAAMLRDAVKESSREALRAGNIVRRMRDFVSRGDLEKHVEDLPDLIEEASRLSLMGARELGIRTFLDLHPSANRVLVDRVQIQQVLVNLVRNAIDALAASQLRDLTISTAPDVRGMVRISVEDTGAGLSSAIERQLFRAFNSTKDQGMGLGLSICRTIVEAHGGRIWAEPRPGGGAIFRFTVMGAGTGADDDDDDGKADHTPR